MAPSGLRERQRHRVARGLQRTRAEFEIEKGLLSRLETRSHRQRRQRNSCVCPRTSPIPRSGYRRPRPHRRCASTVSPLAIAVAVRSHRRAVRCPRGQHGRRRWRVRGRHVHLCRSATAILGPRRWRHPGGRARPQGSTRCRGYAGRSSSFPRQLPVQRDLRAAVTIPDEPVDSAAMTVHVGVSLERAACHHRGHQLPFRRRVFRPHQPRRGVSQ